MRSVLSRDIPTGDFSLRETACLFDGSSLYHVFLPYCGRDGVLEVIQGCLNGIWVQ